MGQFCAGRGSRNLVLWVEARRTSRCATPACHDFLLSVLRPPVTETGGISISCNLGFALPDYCFMYSANRCSWNERDSNPRPLPLQGSTLPLSYRSIKNKFWCEPSTHDPRCYCKYLGMSLGLPQYYNDAFHLYYVFQLNIRAATYAPQNSISK